MQSQHLDIQTFRKLRAERIKQIQREGAIVTFRSQSYPFRQHFTYDPSFQNRVYDLLSQNKFALELTDGEGDEIFKFKPSQLSLPKGSEEGGRIFLSSDRHLAWAGVRNGCSYYLAKVNPTINAYKGLYSLDNNEYQMQEFTESAHIIAYFRGEAASVQTKRELDFPYQKDFNEGQNEAIRKCGRNCLSFIKGPPGCGKTKTIGRLCKLFLSAGLKVIVGAVSNTGNMSIIRQLVNELSQFNNTSILEKYYYQFAESNPAGYYELLAGFYEQHVKVNMLFFPHFEMREEELPPLARLYSYDTQVIKNMIKVSNGINTPYLITQYRKLKDKEVIDKKFYAIFMQAVHVTVLEARIIVATTVRAKTINARLQEGYEFRPDVAILDEASQSSCSDTLCYLKLDVQRLVLVGDEKQLNPTVISNDKMLKQSFFNKFSQRREEYFTMLNKQYRMHPSISLISNHFFYNSLIQDGVSASDRQSGVTPFSNHPVLFINCPHKEHEELQETMSGNRKIYVNYHEVYIIKSYLQFFAPALLPSVGIITPYMEQLKLLQKELWKEVKEGLTIKTCDGFQGGERDYIFISLVRSNQQGNIGFCSEETRINVSVSRAKRGMMIVGNYQTFAKSPNFWALIINHIHCHNAAYFDFTLTIPQEEIDRLMALHKTEDRPVRTPYEPPQEVQGYLSYQDYVNEFFKDSPEVSEAMLQTYYVAYVSQVQTWIYEQQYDQGVRQEAEKMEEKGEAKEKEKANMTLEMLRGDLEKEDSEDEDEVERLIRKNKAEAKLLRKLDFLRVGGPAGKTVQTYLSEIQTIFQQVPLDCRQISKRMTRSSRRQALAHLQSPAPSPLPPLRQFLALISDKAYPDSHLKGSENVSRLIFWMLTKKLWESL